MLTAASHPHSCRHRQQPGSGLSGCFITFCESGGSVRVAAVCADEVGAAGVGDSGIRGPRDTCLLQLAPCLWSRQGSAATSRWGQGWCSSAIKCLQRGPQGTGALGCIGPRAGERGGQDAAAALIAVAPV